MNLPNNARCAGAQDVTPRGMARLKEGFGEPSCSSVPSPNSLCYKNLWANTFQIISLQKILKGEDTIKDLIGVALGGRRHLRKKQR